jgi:hypothetical protein
MKKSEFREVVLQMGHPVLKEINLKTALLSSCLCLEDQEKLYVSPSGKNYVEFETLKLTEREYLAGNLASYYHRERKMKQKYERWLYEYCGNYCTSAIAISDVDIGKE